jgi:hypothetical protein
MTEATERQNRRHRATAKLQRSMGSPPLRSARPFSRASVIAVAVLSMAACTSDDASPAAAHGSPRTSPPPVTSADAFVFTDAAGIEARLSVGGDGDGAVLEVVNDSGAELPEPGIFVLDARDGARTTWTVVGAAPVPARDRAEFAVERPAVPDAKHLGLVVMLFGGEDYGAFVPPR